MREKLTVIKVGGKIVEEEATLHKLLNDFAAIEGYKVLVHGGGRSATKLAARLGIDGRYPFCETPCERGGLRFRGRCEASECGISG